MKESEMGKLLSQFEQIKEEKGISEEKRAQRGKEHARYKKMTNQGLEDDENLFSRYCFKNKISQTKRQASKHREEFLEWILNREE